LRRNEPSVEALTFVPAFRDVRESKRSQEAQMSAKFLSLLCGVALAGAATSAFAFDAMVTAPRLMRAHPSHHAAVIGSVPANAIVDMARCSHGWCEAAYDGRMGYIYTPTLVSTGPTAPEFDAPLGVITLPVAAAATVVDAAVGVPAAVLVH
jgi:uncharacterized protein YraI